MKRLAVLGLLALCLTGCGNYNRQNFPDHTKVKQINGHECIVTNAGGIWCEEAAK